MAFFPNHAATCDCYFCAGPQMPPAKTSVNGMFLFTHHHGQKCEHCNGKGFLAGETDRYDYRVFDSPEVTEYPDCRECNATGIKSDKRFRRLRHTVKDYEEEFA